MFKERSEKKELLDEENIPSKELELNLAELEIINRKLGGHRATELGIEKFIHDRNKTYRIVDFACGGGDTLRHLAKWSEKKKIKLELSGFDLLPDAISFAKKQSINDAINFQVADFKNYDNTHCDIAICSLVCHHFYEKTLSDFILKMYNSAKIGIVINDLHRHPIAYFGISILSSLFSNSYLVKHDAKLSVLKGFTKKEWLQILKENQIKNFDIEWIWAFRHLISIYK